MTDEQDSGRPLALVHEAADEEGGAPVAAGLRRLGWLARPMGDDPGEVAAAGAGLWAVDVSAPDPDPWPFLDALAGAGTPAPLLVVADAGQVGGCTRELTRLLRTWPAPLQLLVRPYSPQELGLRVFWLALGGARAARSDSAYELGALRVDTGRYKASYSGRPVTLTLAEFRILVALIEADGRGVSREELTRLMHGAGARVQEKAIDPHVSRLRDKLAAAGADPGAIRTIRGVGYSLESALL